MTIIIVEFIYLCRFNYPGFLEGFVLLDRSFLCDVLKIIVCPFVFFFCWPWHCSSFSDLRHPIACVLWIYNDYIGRCDRWPYLESTTPPARTLKTCFIDYEKCRHIVAVKNVICFVLTKFSINFHWQSKVVAMVSQFPHPFLHKIHILFKLFSSSVCMKYFP